MSETGFLNRTITIRSVTYRYVVYVPGEWTKNRDWPVVLFLHGSIEKGEDGLLQSYVGLGAQLRHHADRYPSIVVMPQCRREVDWNAPSMAAQALGAMDAAMKEFNGDAKRIYLTGFSMGGYGTWNMAAKHPSRFAALVVVCGGILWPPGVAMRPLAQGSDNPYTRTARAVAHIPTWVFHGDQDRNVPVTESQRMVDALKTLGSQVRYTEYAGVAHECWDQVYAEPELPKWLFAQHLDVKISKP
jgi:predicted peptidase